MRLLALIFILVGCSQPPKPVTPPPPQYIEHTVKYQGETLAGISAWYLGDLKRWKEIVAANPGLKPERMKIGDVIKVPASGAVRRDPLPKPKVSKKPVVVEEKAESVETPAEKPAEETKAEEPKAEEKPAENAEAKPAEPEVKQEVAPVTEEDREKLREKTRLELLQDVLNQNP